MKHLKRIFLFSLLFSTCTSPVQEQGKKKPEAKITKAASIIPGPDTLIPPKVIYLNNRPSPQTITVPLTQAQAQGKKIINHWGRDTIEQTNEIPLAPPQTTL
ncbi:MAG: hypothetical protein ABIK31_08070 [candidate division WOR-3 bacterium]